MDSYTYMDRYNRKRSGGNDPSVVYQGI